MRTANSRYFGPLQALPALFLLLSGCTGDDVSSGSESDGTTTGGAPTTGETEAPSTDATTDATATTTTGDMTSGDPTTTTEGTGGAEDLPGACQAYCEAYAECKPEELDPEEVPTCVEGCIEIFSGTDMTEPCIAAKIAAIECSTEADCEESTSEACAPALRELLAACDEVTCSGHPIEGAESCGWRWECSDGSVEEMACDGATCACLVDGVQVGECDNDICAEDLDPRELFYKYDACCG